MYNNGLGLAITENVGKPVIDADLLISLSKERTAKDIIQMLLDECDRLRKENAILKNTKILKKDI